MVQPTFIGSIWILLATVMMNQLQTLLVILGATFIKIAISKTFRIWIGILVVFTTFPVVKGAPAVEDPFPNITFKAFNEFIK